MLYKLLLYKGRAKSTSRVAAVWVNVTEIMFKYYRFAPDIMFIIINAS